MHTQAIEISRTWKADLRVDHSPERSIVIRYWRDYALPMSFVASANDGLPSVDDSQSGLSLFIAVEHSKIRVIHRPLLSDFSSTSVVVKYSPLMMAPIALLMIDLWFLV